MQLEKRVQSWYLNREEVRARKPRAVRKGPGWRMLGKAGDKQVCSVTHPARQAQDRGE